MNQYQYSIRPGRKVKDFLAMLYMNNVA